MRCVPWLFAFLLAGACSESRTTPPFGDSDADTDSDADADGGDGDGDTDGDGDGDESDCSGQAPAALAVNEIHASGQDWVEIRNDGASAIDMACLSITDSDGAGSPQVDRAIPFPERLVLGAGAYFVVLFEPDVVGEGLQTGEACLLDGVDECIHTDFGISNGDGDAVFLLDRSVAIVATAEYPAGAVADEETWCRLPDGTGAFDVCVPTPDAANRGVAAPEPGVLVVNEIQPSGQDWIELAVVGETAVSLAGLSITDDDGGTPNVAHTTALADVSIEPGGHLVVVAGLDAPEPGLQTGAACVVEGLAECLQAGFGLSRADGDAVYVLDGAGAVVATAVLPADAVTEVQSWGRLPDGSGDLTVTRPTPAAANAAP